MKQLMIKIVSEGYVGRTKFYTIVIIGQTHRNSYFAEKSDTFRASNGYTLSSVGCPQWKADDKKLFVRGCEKKFDNEELQVAEKDYNKLLAAIEEYNKKFMFTPDGQSILPDNLFEV